MGCATKDALSALGGVLILIGGALVAFNNSAISFFGYLANGGSSGTTVTLVGIVGMIMGLIVIAGGVMMKSKPDKSKMWGAVVVVFSILSWFTAVGGLVAGSLIGLAGGIMAIRFKPSAASTAPPASKSP
ncbi:MAG TPA: DUF6114 domain-containing protein [Candidatus Bathyarchaeia archaeon]|nr:DUF6114 domain-containing protein [Candidatus Bathyarchaeia archaeon]